MVWYYCEFCNKNINVESGIIPTCNQCSNLLTYSTMDSAEINRRKRERTTYCKVCNIMVYAVYIQDAINSVIKSGDINVQSALELIKKKKKRETVIIEAKNTTNKLYSTLLNLGKSFQFICKGCWNGLKLNERYPIKTQIGKSNLPESFFCEMCGIENSSSSKFCTKCGINLEYIKVNYFSSDFERSRHIPAKIRYEVYRRDGGKCVTCGSSDNIQFDHVLPFSKGGAHTLENLQLLCQNCNLRKSDRLDI